MGIFSNIENAKGTEGGVYFEPGNFLAEIQRCKEFTTRKNIRTFVAEFVILESDNPNMKVGTPVSYMVSFKDPDLEELYKGNVADFMRAALSALASQKHNTKIEPKDVPLDEASANQICGDKNPLLGVKVIAIAFNKPTKAGDDFTRVKWGVPGITPAAKVPVAK